VPARELPRCHASRVEPAGEIERALLDAVAELKIEPGGAKHVMALVARRLAAALDARPSASAARELRATISHLMEGPVGAEEDVLDEIRAKLARQRLEALFGETIE
jgi:hypothetical protein